MSNIKVNILKADSEEAHNFQPNDKNKHLKISLVVLESFKLFKSLQLFH